jgi:hypothetical protein
MSELAIFRQPDNWHPWNNGAVILVDVVLEDYPVLFSLLLPVHITGGIVGMLSGSAALSFRKDSRRHAIAGRIFVVSMLIMAAAAVCLAVLKHETPNILAGTLTFYLITTAWLTARRRRGETSVLDWAIVLIPVAGCAWTWTVAVEKLFSHNPPRDGVPLAIDLFVGSVMFLAASGDIGMILSGGLSKKDRILRHLWRMCFGLFIATASFFLGQQQVFPAVQRGSTLLVVLAVFPLGLLIFWFFRVRYAREAQA